MPRVLIEMGFVSNKEEGAFLNSEQGQEKLAEAIAGSILDYKNEFFNPTNEQVVKEKEPVKITPVEEKVTPKEQPKQVENTTNKGVIFKVQISASAKKLATTPSNFKGLKNISIEQSGKLYKYFYGSEKSYEDSKKRLEEAKQKGYTSAFVVAYKDGIKISVSDAIK